MAWPFALECRWWVVLLPQKEHFGENTNSVTAGRKSLFLIELRNSPKHVIKTPTCFVEHATVLKSPWNESFYLDEHDCIRVFSLIWFKTGSEFDLKANDSRINQNAWHFKPLGMEINIDQCGEARNLITAPELNNRPNERIAHLRGTRDSHYWLLSLRRCHWFFAHPPTLSAKSICVYMYIRRLTKNKDLVLELISPPSRHRLYLKMQLCKF